MSKIKLLFSVALWFLIACHVVAPVQAQDPYPPDEVLVIARTGVSIDTINERFGTKVLDHISGTPFFRLALPSGTDVLEALDLMYRARLINGGEPNYFIGTPEAQQSSMAFVDDADFPFVDQNSPPTYFNQPALEQVRARQAHKIATGQGIVIAVIDTGITFNHPALKNRIAAPYYDFVDNDDDPSEVPGGMGFGHGTFISGILALLAPDARIMPLRALDSEGRGYAFNITKAIYFAVQNGARVINMSFGMDRPSDLIRRAIEAARDVTRDLTRPVIFVASAGNDNRRDPQQYPAWDPNVFAVAAVDNEDIKADFSNFGWHISFAAPGVDIYSTFPRTLRVNNDGFARWSGTSFAAPFVAADAALILEQFPDAPFSQISARMKDWYRVIHIDHLNPDYVGQLGRGRIDLLRAVSPDPRP